MSARAGTRSDGLPGRRQGERDARWWKSTRPDAEDIGVDQEIGRVLPVLRAIRAAYPEAVLSVDTFRAPVAEAALAAGADCGGIAPPAPIPQPPATPG
jgi:hypothetical protein